MTEEIDLLDLADSISDLEAQIAGLRAQMTFFGVTFQGKLLDALLASAEALTVKVGLVLAARKRK